jgi:beta-lactamase superfamily II metal-dependent hydrolase
MPMTVDFFDVGHGNCTMITAPNGKTMMIDCGHSQRRPWYPSEHFAGQTIEFLVVTNFDEDHVSDFPGVIDRCFINAFYWNTSITPNDLLYVKDDSPLGKGIEALHEVMVANQDYSSWNYFPDLGPIERTHFFNRYPSSFDDANNLSVVTFISYAGHKFVFPGDLEEAGWLSLLKRPGFAEELKDVNVFVASHHGRKSGCCAEVFDHCNPRIVVMSDRNKAFDTQETVPWYASRVSGVDWLGAKRYVYTTRNYGDIRITIKDDGTWAIDVQKGV